jgi:NAD(P)-dependent dehydrogenase (short-subunit alcohol dehydrogenase family)
MFSLKNKIIIVTGASGMLGREHVKAILNAEGIPILLDLNQNVLDSQVNELKEIYNQPISGYAVDITDEEKVKNNCEEIVLKYHKIDGLVNNAANNPKVEKSDDINFSRLENFPVSIWDKDLDVALKGTFLCTKYYGFEISKNIDNANFKYPKSRDSPAVTRSYSNIATFVGGMFASLIAELKTEYTFA